MPSPLTAVGFGSFPFDRIGMADTFIRLRPEHFVKFYGPVLTQVTAPTIATPKEAEREGQWEPRYGLEWWPVDSQPTLSAAEILTPWKEQQRQMERQGPDPIDVTPELIRKLLRR